MRHATRAVLWWRAGIMIAACVMMATRGLCAEEFTFDAEKFETKPFELRGYAEVEPSYAETSKALSGRSTRGC